MNSKALAQLTCRVVPFDGLTAKDESAWRELAASALEPNPFMEPDLLLPFVRHTDVAPRSFLALAEDGPSMLACLPLCYLSRWHGFPYPFANTQLRRTIECGTPLVSKEGGAAALAELLRHLCRSHRLWRSRLLVMPKVATDGPVFDSLKTAARAAGTRVHVYDCAERGMLRRGQTCGDQSSGAERKARRRQLRRLEECVGEVSLLDQTGEEAAIERYVALEASGYKRHTGALLSAPGEDVAFAEMCNRYARQRRLHVLSLVAGERTLAMEIWLRAGDGLFAFKKSFDDHLAFGSPGHHLHVRTLPYLLEATDAEWLDTCTASRNEAELRLLPGRRSAATLFIPLSRPLSLSHGAIDREVVQALKALRRVHFWVYERRHAGERQRGSGRKWQPAPRKVSVPRARRSHERTSSLCGEGGPEAVA